MKLGRISRRAFVIGSACSGLGYSFFVEPNWLEVNHYQVKSAQNKNAKSPLKILHLSDLHYSPCVSLEFIATAIELGIAEKPDLILLTGDYITKKNLDVNLHAYSDVLKKLSDTAPCFATFGNHDGGAWAKRGRGYSTLEKVSELLTSARISILHNSAHTLSIKEQSIHLFGLGDLWADEFNPSKTFLNSQDLQDGYRLVLSHNPDTKDQLKEFIWDLMLCGHTHGGQLYLPLIGAPFAPVKDKRFVQGLNAWNGRWIFTTKGVGNLHGARFNCRPEVAILNLGA